MCCRARFPGHEPGDVPRRRLPRGRAWRCGPLVILLLTLGGLPTGATAWAQEPEQPGRLKVERIRSGLLIAPDLKLTSIDGGAGAVAGLYGGFITDRRLLVGAGAYWLAGGPASVDMAYGGGLVEWFANPGGRVDVSLRSLFGAGQATLASTVETPFFNAFRGHTGRPLYGGPGHGRHWNGWFHGLRAARNGNLAWPTSFAFRYRENFLIADPQLSVHLNVTDWLRIGGGAGYRFVGRAGSDRERLQGLTASIGLQLGPP